MTIDLAVIPVAGSGVNLLPSTKSQPKEMLPVGRKPIVQYVVEEMARAGMHRVLLVTGAGKASIENHFDINAELIEHLRQKGREELLGELDFERRELQYLYTRQRRPLGLGDAVLCAKSVVGDQPFVVALGDSILGLQQRATTVSRMIKLFEDKQPDAVIAFEEVAPQHVVRYGIAKTHDTTGPVFRVEDLVEKPTVADAPSRLAVAGRYIFRPTIFPFLAKTEPGRDEEIQLTDAIHALLQDGGTVLGMRLADDEQRFDINDFAGYFRAFVEFALNDPLHGDELQDFMRGLLDTASRG